LQRSNFRHACTSRSERNGRVTPRLLVLFPSSACPDSSQRQALSHANRRMEDRIMLRITSGDREQPMRRSRLAARWLALFVSTVFAAVAVSGCGGGGDTGGGG